MKKLKALVVVGAMSAVSTAAMAADAGAVDIDFGPMLAGVSVAAAVAAIVSMGVMKLAPNFAKWAVNKVASFF